MAGISIEGNIAATTLAVNGALNRAVETIGGTAERYAKERCPVDTGNLRNSITHTRETDGGNPVVVIGTAVEYAPYVELGTGKYAEGGGGRQTPWRYQDDKGNWHTTSGMPPKPYLRPAFENHIDEYRRIVESELKGI